MKIIMGIYTCDEGDILIDGQAVKLGKPAASLAQGIYPVSYTHLDVYKRQHLPCR